jgi:hypothetical protein
LTEAVRQDREFDRAMLTRAQDISSILNDSTLSSDPRKSRPGSFSRIQLGVEETFKPSMLHMDDPDHKRLRDLVSKAFSQRSVESMRGRIDEIASRLLDEVADSSTFDVMEADARIGKDNVDSALFLRDLSIQAVQISQLRNIALYCGNIPADQPYGCVEFFLPPSRDEDICALPQQTPRLSPIRYRCYTAVTSDNRNLSLELTHNVASQRNRDCQTIRLIAKNIPLMGPHSRSTLFQTK